MLAIVLMPRYGIFVLETLLLNQILTKTPDFPTIIFRVIQIHNFISASPTMLFITLQTIPVFLDPVPIRNLVLISLQWCHVWLYWLPIGMTKVWILFTAASKSDIIQDICCFLPVLSHYWESQLCHFSAYLKPWDSDLLSVSLTVSYLGLVPYQEAS